MVKLEKILTDINNPKKYIKTENVEDYFKLPLEERTRWGFWYLVPQFLPWDALEENEKDGGWGEFYARIKKEFPVQYFLREVIINQIDRKIYRIKDNLHNWWIWAFNPQHGELRAAISRNWRDLDSVIVDFLFACICSYVEKENGLKTFTRLIQDKEKYDKLKSRKISKETRAELKKHLEDQWGEVKYFKDYYDSSYPPHAKINEIYQYITGERVRYNKFLQEGKDYVDVDGKVIPWREADEYIEKKDDFFVLEIVKLKNYLWT